MEATAPDLSVRDVFRGPSTPEFAGMDAFARRMTHRFRTMSHLGDRLGDRLTADLETRWTLPRHLAHGLEVFDAGGFEGMIRDWQVRAGYDELTGSEHGPFVIPVDPTVDVGGLSATSAHTQRGRERFRPIAPAVAPVLRRTPARERWRSAGKGGFTAYPERMGQAGRVDGALLRFPEARAVTESEGVRGLVVEDGPATPWGQARPLAMAAQSAERGAAEIIARSQPAQTTPVGLWLEPTSAVRSTAAAPQFTRAPGQRQGSRLAAVLHAPTVPTQGLGVLAQRFLDAPEPTESSLLRRDFLAAEGYAEADFLADRALVEPTTAPVAPMVAADAVQSPAITKGRGAKRVSTPAAAPAVAPRDLAGTPTAIALRPAFAPGTGGRIVATGPSRFDGSAPAESMSATVLSRRVADGPRANAEPRATFATAPLFVSPSASHLLGRRPTTFAPSRTSLVPALSAPLDGYIADSALPGLNSGRFAPAAARAADAAIGAPLARRLAAEANEGAEAFADGRRFDVQPRAPELWSGLDVADTTLVERQASSDAATSTGSAAASATSAAPASSGRRGATRPDTRRTPLAALGELERPQSPPRPTLVSRAQSAAASPAQRLTGRPAPPLARPMSRAPFAPVLLPHFAATPVGRVAQRLLVPTTAPIRSAATRSAADTVLRLNERLAVEAQGSTPAPAPAAPSARGRVGRRASAVQPAMATFTANVVGQKRALAAPSARATFAPSETRLAAPFQLIDGLSLSANQTAEEYPGIVAETLADAITARFPSEEIGPWGPRIVLPGRTLSLADEAPSTELVQPTSAAPDAVPSSDATATPATTGKAKDRKSKVEAAQPATDPRPQSGTSPAPTTAARPTLLSPGRPGLPGALSPAPRLQAAGVTDRPGAIAASRIHSTMPAPMSTVGRGAVGPTAGTPRGTEAPIAAPEIASRSVRAEAGAGSRRPGAPATTITASSSLGGQRGNPGLNAVADAFGPSAGLLSWSWRFAARSAVAPGSEAFLGAVVAAVAAGRMAVSEANALDPFSLSTRFPAIARALGMPSGDAGLVQGSSMVSEGLGIGPQFAGHSTATSALAEDGGPGALLQASHSPSAGGAPQSDPTPEAERGPRQRVPGSAAYSVDLTAGRPGRTPSAPGAAFAPGIFEGQALSRLMVAGRPILLPTSVAMALQRTTERPAILRALARFGSPALASLLADDAPGAVLLESSASRGIAQPGAGTSARSAEGQATMGADGRPIAGRSSGRTDRAAARSLGNLAFTAPRGLRSSGAWPRAAAAAEARAASSPGGRASAGFSAPSLGSLILPEGRFASPQVADASSPESYFRIGNLDRALVAFDQAASRHPASAAPQSDSASQSEGSGLASSVMRAMSGRRSSAPGAASAPGTLATPGASPTTNSPTLSAMGAPGSDDRALVAPSSPAQSQPIFGNRGPKVSITSPQAPQGRVMVDTGARAGGSSSGPLRSTDGERPTRQAETGEEARHRLAEGQIEESLSPEELDKIATEVISQLKRQIELDAIRVGEDEWD